MRLLVQENFLIQEKRLLLFHFLLQLHIMEANRFQIILKLVHSFI